MIAQTLPLPAKECPLIEKELLTMILDNAHIYDCAIRGKSVLTVLLSSTQVDRLSCYDACVEDLEDSYDAEQEDAA